MLGRLAVRSGSISKLSSSHQVWFSCINSGRRRHSNYIHCAPSRSIAEGVLRNNAIKWPTFHRRNQSIVTHSMGSDQGALGLSVLTWNVACMESSASAPPSWPPSLHKQKVAELLLQSKADIICLQELEYNLQGDEIHSQYDKFGFAQSHCGHVQILVNKSSGITVVDSLEDGPAVFAVMMKDGVQFFVVSCHLAPFKDGAGHRLRQMQEMRKLLPPGAPVVVAGDFNVREDETAGAAAALRCEDAFALAGSPSGQKFTWDSRRNKYHRECFEYTCRYDRVFVGGWKVRDFQVVANTPVSENKGHFLSDHFGLLVKLELDQRT